MSIRDILKQREAAREEAKNNAGGASDLPDGIGRYIKLGSFGEVNKDGKTFIMLASPDDWMYYFVHEDKTYDGKKTIHNFQKHTCLHSPKDKGADLADFFTKNGNVCPSCKAGAKRKMFAMIPLYDMEYGTWRVIDCVEFHFNNLINDYDKAEKPAKKFNKDYTLVGDAVFIKQVDKSFALESGDLTDEQEEHLEKAKAFIGIDYKYEDLAFFREEDDVIRILNEATGGVDLAKLEVKPNVTEEM